MLFSSYLAKIMQEKIDIIFPHAIPVKPVSIVSNSIFYFGKIQLHIFFISKPSSFEIL